MLVLDSCTAKTPHAAELVFAKWADPATWPTWDSEVREVSFSGPARLGARGRMRPASGPTASFSITSFEPGRLFTNASSLPGAKLIFEHRVTPNPGGSMVDVTVGVEGFLASLWRRILRKNLGHAARSSVAGLLSHLDAA